MIVVTSDWEIQVVGRRNPFRYYEVTKLFNPQTETVSPSGGDDTKAIQAAIDRSASGVVPQLVKVGIERKWKWPWKYQSGLKEISIVQSRVVSLLAGTYDISKTLDLPSTVRVEGMGPDNTTLHIKHLGPWFSGEQKPMTDIYIRGNKWRGK